MHLDMPGFVSHEVVGSQREVRRVSSGADANLSWVEENGALTSKNIRPEAEALIIDSLIQFGHEPAELSMDTVLVTLDVSSLDIMELIQVIRHRFGVILDAHRIAACNTLEDVVDLIAESVEDVQDTVS